WGTPPDPRQEAPPPAPLLAAGGPIVVLSTQHSGLSTGSEYAVADEEGDGGANVVFRFVLVDLEDFQCRLGYEGGDDVPLDLALAGRKVVAGADDVVQVHADGLPRERFQPRL